MLLLLLAQIEKGLFETLAQAATQVPALVVLVIVVYVFLTHMKSIQADQAIKDAKFHESLKASDEHMTTLVDTCHIAHKEMSEASKEFHKTLTKDTHEALAECKTVIKDNTIALTGIRNELMKKGNMGS
jgi:predicted Holliday junction resolvase-like endonuclease